VQAGRDFNIVLGPIQIDPAIMERISPGEYRVHIYGRITYLDVFDVTHHVGFGHTHDPEVSVGFRITRMPATTLKISASQTTIPTLSASITFPVSETRIIDSLFADHLDHQAA